MVGVCVWVCVFEYVISVSLSLYQKCEWANDAAAAPSVAYTKYTKFMNTNAHTNNIAGKQFRAQQTSEQQQKTESIYWLDVVDVVAVVCDVSCLLAIFIVFGAYEFVSICVMPFIRVILYPTKLLFSLQFHSVEWFLEWRPNISRQINFCHECHIIIA